MEIADIFPYHEPAIALVNYIVEPTLLDFTKRMHSPFGSSELEKLSLILSLQISRVYIRSGLEVRSTDAGAVLMANNAVDIAWQYMDDLRQALVWYSYDETPVLSLYESDLTFSQFMDAYFFVLGHRLGDGEFAGMPVPPSELTEMIFRLFSQKSLEWVNPTICLGPQELKQWLSEKLICSARRYLEERIQLVSDIKTGLSEIFSGTCKNSFTLALRKRDVAFLQSTLEELPTKPTPLCARYGWLEEMEDWFDFSWLNDRQLEKMRYELSMVGYANRGVEREFGRRKGIICGMRCEPGPPPNREK